MKKKQKKISSQPLAVEGSDIIWLCTAKCIRGELWFVNNPGLEERIFAFLAMYVEKYRAELYSVYILGNHYHLQIRFPYNNKAAFFRDFNARVAESVRQLVPGFESGPLFKRRYTPQILADAETVEDKFFYTWLQPVTTGLCARVSEYPAKCLFSDAVRGLRREYKYLSFAEYNEAKKRDPRVARDKFWKTHTLKFTPLPEYSNLSKSNYEKLMFEKFEARRVEEVAKSNSRFRTRAELRKVRPGSRPRKSKDGDRRPLVLAASMEAKRRALDWYFSLVAQYQEACEKYRRGDFQVVFPDGMYRPPGTAIY